MSYYCGQIISVKIVELIGSDGIIVSLDGRLIRVQNQSGVRFQAGEFVSLQITAVRPAKFKVVGAVGPRSFSRSV